MDGSDRFATAAALHSFQKRSTRGGAEQNDATDKFAREVTWSAISCMHVSKITIYPRHLTGVTRPCCPKNSDRCYETVLHCVIARPGDRVPEVDKAVATAKSVLQGSIDPHDKI